MKTKTIFVIVSADSSYRGFFVKSEKITSSSCHQGYLSLEITYLWCNSKQTGGMESRSEHADNIVLITSWEMDGPVFLEIEAYEAKSQDISIVSTSHEKYTTVSLCLNMF